MIITDSAFVNIGVTVVYDNQSEINFDIAGPEDYKLEKKEFVYIGRLRVTHIHIQHRGATKK